MKYQVVFTLFLFLFQFQAIADPLEDLTYAEAEKVIDYLKKQPMILDYCDCCDSGEGYLIKVANATIEKAEYGSRSYRIRVLGQIFYNISLQEDGTFKMSETDQSAYNEVIYTNYTFLFDPSDKKAHPMGQVLQIREDASCNSNASFPDPGQIRLESINRDYLSWYKEHVGYFPSEMDLGQITNFPEHTKLKEEQVPPNIYFHGDLVQAVSWMEADGMHYFLVSEIYDRETGYNTMFVCQYIQQGRSYLLQWNIRDFAKKGGGQVIFENGSLQLLDIDDDQELETCFFYTIQRDDPEFRRVKMMIHDGDYKLAVRSGALRFSDRTFDTAFRNKPICFRGYARFAWQRFREDGEAAWADDILLRKSGTILFRQEYQFASGGYEYRLFNSDFELIPESVEQQEIVRYADEFSTFPDQSALLIMSMPYVAHFDFESGQFTEMMQVFDQTDGVSSIRWSEDGTQIGFVVLNFEEYPENTRIFVLDLDGHKIKRKQKFDVKARYFAANVMVLDPITFMLEPNTIQYMKMFNGPENAVQETLKLD